MEGVISLPHLERVQVILEALEAFGNIALDSKRSPAVAVVACEDAIIACSIGLSMGLSYRQIVEQARNILNRERFYQKASIPPVHDRENS